MLLKLEDFSALVSSLESKVVSHAWKGYGSAIFLELGTLVPSKRHPSGEASISLEWDWRIESNTEIVGGSSQDGAQIDNLVRSLIGLEIAAIEISAAPCELCITLSDSKRIRSMAAVPGDPQWSINLSSGRWLSSVSGALKIDDS
jgi:hypothetical protein